MKAIILFPAWLGRVHPGIAPEIERGAGRDGALRRPRRRAQRQATERITANVRFHAFVPPADAGGDGAARHPYQGAVSGCAWLKRGMTLTGFTLGAACLPACLALAQSPVT